MNQPLTSSRRRGPARENLIGRRSGQLTVLASAPHSTRGPRWLCACECGRQTIVRSDAIKAGRTVSCGCRQKQAAAATLRTWWAQSDRKGSAHRHGHAGDKAHGRKTSRTYHSWVAMRQRCNNPKASKYPRYGARGIVVCPAWNTSFEAFLADMGVRPEGSTLDRINPAGHYEPGNCRWATPELQAWNRRRSAPPAAEDLADSFSAP